MVVVPVALSGVAVSMGMKILINAEVDEDFSEDFLCLVQEAVEKLSPDYIIGKHSVEKFDDENARFVADLLADKCMKSIISIIYTGADDNEKVDRIIYRLNEMSKNSTSFAGRNKLVVAKSAIKLMDKVRDMMHGDDDVDLDKLAEITKEWDNSNSKIQKMLEPEGFKEGDKSKGICPVCDKMVTTVMKYGNLECDDTVIIDVLLGFCEVCDGIVSIPHYPSSDKIKRYQEKHNLNLMDNLKKKEK